VRVVSREEIRSEREKITAFVVCYNEEDHIGACLDSVSFCDEVIVVDSFSQDRTVRICKQKGANVIQRNWPGYREQKAFGLSQCTHPWVLNLDADERVSDELRESILAVLVADYNHKHVVGDSVARSSAAGDNFAPCRDGYELSRVVYYLGRWWRKGGWYPEYRVRFFRREKVTWGGIDPHEKAVVHGVTARLEGELQHFTYKNLNEQFARLRNYAAISSQEEYLSGGRSSILKIVCNPLLRMFKFYFLKRGYREGIAGLIVAIIEGYYTFMKYAFLWELGRDSGGEAHQLWEAEQRQLGKTADSPEGELYDSPVRSNRSI